MTLDRRHFLAATGALLTTACATVPRMTAFPPIVFVHGNGDSASIWQALVWRFESNGWPRERLHALDLPYPTARDDDARPQPGRTSAAEHLAAIRAAVEQVLAETGASQLVLVGLSRGGLGIRDYIANGGGAAKVSHAVLGGTPNHGAWVSLPGLPDGNEFAGASAYLRALNAPKNARGDEVAGPVRWLTLRSDGRDKYAQADGRWLGKPGQPTGITADGPALQGASNVVLPGVDHRETALAPAAFEAMFRFLTGRAPATLEIVPEQRVVLAGKVTGLGLSSTDPASGNFANNLPLPGARLRVFALAPDSGERMAQVHAQTVGADGRWGPLAVAPGTACEFELAAPGYATTHIYRSPFPRSSTLVHLRPERLAAAEREAPAVVVFTRPRGYFEPGRDRMAFDGQSPPPGVPPGAGVSSSRIRPAATPRWANSTGSGSWAGSGRARWRCWS